MRGKSPTKTIAKMVLPFKLRGGRRRFTAVIQPSQREHLKTMVNVNIFDV